ncbi:MAG: DNA alkylation repair protein [Candidatus Buchananbacteria bacterium]
MLTSKLQKFKKELNKLADKKQAAILQRFFKTKKGEYGAGDVFLGIMVPKQRLLARNYLDLSLAELQTLLNNKIHEYRLIALIILTQQYAKADLINKKKIFNFYLKNFNHINNWDLVDLSAPNIIGNYLLPEPRDVLYDFAQSNNLWKKRIAIISTFSFIRQNQFSDTIKIAKILLLDRHDLIQKAVGWMLREMGKRDEKLLRHFLDKNAKIMPRTMLRYAIEKLPEKDRQYYLYKKRP